MGSSSRDTLWLGKEKLTDHGRCEGKFASAISGESPPFEHSPKSAAGVLLAPRGGGRGGRARRLGRVRTIAEIAADRLVEREERFAEYWRGLAPADRDGVLMEVARRIDHVPGVVPAVEGAASRADARSRRCP